MRDKILKVCSICREEKPLEEFSKNKCKKDGLQTHCKTCNKERSKHYYHSNREHHYKVTKDRQKNQIHRSEEFVLMFLKTHPCVDCGEADPIVLEFDHVVEGKKDSICGMIYKGSCINSILKEIEKCEVRCCNCHRRKTAKQFNQFRYRINMGSWCQ